MKDTIIDFLYDSWYATIDHPLRSVVIFLGLSGAAWGSYILIPESTVINDTAVIAETETGSSTTEAL